jgi:DNA-binding response OmpR family regulator
LSSDFEVVPITSLAGLSGILASATADVMIADLELSDGSLVNFARNDGIRKQLAAIPTIVVSVTDDVEVLTECTRLWAVDYMTKPFDNNELRFKCLKHAGALKPEFDAVRMQVAWRRQRSEPLTAIEAQVFNLFRGAMDVPVTRLDLAQGVWGVKRDTPRIDATMSRLRKKLEGVGLTIKTVRPGEVVLTVGAPEPQRF